MQQCRVTLLIIGIFLLVPFHVVPLLAASFDCKKATTSVEKMVCSDVKLTKLDEELAAVYLQALALAPNREALKTEQRNWVKKGRHACANTGCLSSSYETRISALKRRSGKEVAAPNLDERLFGKWESYGTAFYKTGTITITLSALVHESCKHKFKYIKHDGLNYYFQSKIKNSCYAFSHQPLNVIKIKLDGEELTVRYYSDTNENNLLGEGTYTKIE